MRCVVDGCTDPAICRYCLVHQPQDLAALGLERPAIGPDAETVDLRPVREEQHEAA